jgi:hypothetical protein
MAGAFLGLLGSGPLGADGITVHGNWCGPGTSLALARGLPAVDPLDAACRRHDLCYLRRGGQDCGCDLAFMRELAHLPYPPYGDYRRKGRAIYDLIAAKPCTGPRMLNKWALGMGTMAEDYLSGRVPPWAPFRRWAELLGEAR